MKAIKKIGSVTVLTLILFQAMDKAKFLVMFMLLTSTAIVGQPAHASNYPNGPTICCDAGGNRYPQGTNPMMQQQQQGQFGGNQIMIPAGVVAGQPFTTNVGGVQMRCTIADRVVSAVEQGLMVGFVGLAADRITALGNPNGSKTNYAAQGAWLGAAAGATITCTPGEAASFQQSAVQNVNYSSQPQPVAPPQMTCDGNKRPGKLNLPSDPLNGQTVCAHAGDPNVQFY